MYYSQTLGKECSPLEFIDIKTLLNDLKSLANKELHNPVKVLQNSRIEYLNKIIKACEGWDVIESDSIDDSEIFNV